MTAEVHTLELADLEEAILPLVSRPARYLPLIQGLRRRPRHPALEAVVAVPDVIEAAAMHPVVAALYHGLADAGAAVELAFLPWTDFEAELRKLRWPLFSLESRRPLATFDLICVPVLRELQATGVVEILDLGGIPILAAERSAADPVVVGTGPALANPEPLAPFFDAVLLGDPEALLSELTATVAEFRGGGSPGRRSPRRRAELGPALADRGVYVPAAFEMAPDRHGHLVAAGDTQVHAAYLDALPPPAPPLKPLIEVRGDLLEIEVMRGCPRACRFCQPARAAGPLRERTAAGVAAAVEHGVETGGWEEVMLGGLMPADWSGLAPAAGSLGRWLLERGTALSLGAVAGESTDRALLHEMSRIRRTTLAFAPEAGTERLRRVIGKPLDESRLLEAVTAASARGWLSIKLHFMIGLPTETDDDLMAIADLAQRVRAAGQGTGGRFAVQLAVHPFVPRAHTPLQWEGQPPLAELRRRLQRLRALLRRRPLQLRWGHPEAAQIEALVARGDRRLAGVIRRAYSSGARLDGWTEHLRPVLWWRAAAAAGIDTAAALGRRDPASPLPWSHLVLGRGEAHFAAEREAAHRGEAPRIRAAAPVSMPVAWEPAPLPSPRAAARHDPTREAALGLYGRGRTRRRSGGRLTARRQRVRYVKTDSVRFISHLDVVRLLDRTLRRAGIPVAYSGGFSRHPKLSFGPPLSVGMTGRDEYFDIELLDERPVELVELLNLHLHDGLRMIEAVPIETASPSLMSLVDHADFRITFPRHARRLLGDPGPVPFRASLGEAIQSFFSHDRAFVLQAGPDGERPAELRSGVRRLELIDGDDAYPALDLTLRIAGGGAIRPLDLAGFLLGEDRLDARLLRVERRRLFGFKGGREVTPFEAAAGEELTSALALADGSSGTGNPDVQRNRDQRRSSGNAYRHSGRWGAG